jgi:hypothetical protein
LSSRSPSKKRCAGRSGTAPPVDVSVRRPNSGPSVGRIAAVELTVGEGVALVR